eukprot:SAG31_NODE_63_length_28659_cov_23.074685_9_plen_296_part_00
MNQEHETANSQPHLQSRSYPVHQSDRHVCNRTCDWQHEDAKHAQNMIVSVTGNRVRSYLLSSQGTQQRQQNPAQQLRNISGAVPANARVGEPKLQRRAEKDDQRQNFAEGAEVKNSVFPRAAAGHCNAAAEQCCVDRSWQPWISSRSCRGRGLRRHPGLKFTAVHSTPAHSIPDCGWLSLTAPCSSSLKCELIYAAMQERQDVPDTSLIMQLYESRALMSVHAAPHSVRPATALAGRFNASILVSPSLGHPLKDYAEACREQDPPIQAAGRRLAHLPAGALRLAMDRFWHGLSKI